MLIRKCDCCGQEINVYVQVQTTICVTNDYTNVSDMLHLQKKLDLCKSCAEKVFENIQLFMNRGR